VKPKFCNWRTRSSRPVAAWSDEPEWNLTVPQKLDSVLSCLAKAHTGLLSAADVVPVENWKTAPGEGRWSAAELVAHLMMV
jgi:hypothetical protein